MEQFGLGIEIPSVVCEETSLANEEYFLSKSNPMSSVNTNRKRERERGQKRNWSIATFKRTRLNSILKMESRVEFLKLGSFQI